MRARIISATKDSFKLLLDDGRLVLGQIKGKTLKNANYLETAALVSGDYVKVECKNDYYLICEREKRFSYFTRYNFLKRKNQCIGANFDILCLLVSHSSPALNQYFVNTALAGLSGKAECVFIATKSDIEFSKSDMEVFDTLKNAGFSVLFISSISNDGIDKFKDIIRNKTALLVGESGCGKSSLLNAVFSANLQSVGSLSKKTNTGCHTTTSSFLMSGEEFCIIDTPGIRYVLPSVDKIDIARVFPEFMFHPCRFSNCKHINEDGCAVREAVEKDIINKKRYDCYLKLLNGCSKNYNEKMR